jgi:hypothetical protein
MRRPALALLVAVSGCNWIYGNSATILVDGSADSPDAPDPAHDRLVWGIATTNMSGAPIDPQLKPIGSETLRDMVPTIMVGEPLGGMALTTAPYDIATGLFDVPFHLRDVPHRIVYTLPNETVPHEIQWSIAGAVIVVPRSTRFDAPTIPAGSGYAITPTGLTGFLSAPSITTTGVFSFDRTSPFGTTGTSTMTYNFDMYADMLTTPRGAPQGSLGDYVMLGEWTSRSSTQDSLTGFAITHIDLTDANSAPTAEPAWVSTAANRTLTTASGCGQDCIPNIDSTTVASRFMDNLPNLNWTTKTQFLAYGVSPTTKLPGFVPGLPSQDYVDQPLILPFATSRSIDSTIPLADPTKLDLLPSYTRVLTARVSGKRVIDGATLTSSIQTITNAFTGQLEFKAPLAISVKLGANDLTVSDIPNILQIDASSQATTLSWANEPGLSADDYVVTLYEITNNKLAPLRIYHVLTAAVTVDGSQLTPGHKYAFSITARIGFSKAKQGNYSPDTVTYPFYETTTFPTAFLVKP